MSTDTKFVCFFVSLIIMSLLMGCGKSGDGGTPSTNLPPTVTVTSNPGDSIYYNQNADFSWQGNDQDGTITQYYAGLDGNLTATTNTTASYSGFNMGDSYVFSVVAEDNEGAISDSAQWTFHIYSTSPVPTVTIISAPADSIFSNEDAVFIWQGSDPNDDIAGYHTGLDGTWDFITDTTAAYSSFSQGTSHLFQLVAEDDLGFTSDTADWSFDIVTADVITYANGEGVNDADGDGFWTEFAVNWSPRVTNSQQYDIRLIINVQPSYGGVEWTDSTALITRNPGDDDTLTYTLPTFTKDLYDISLSLHGSDGLPIYDIPYGSIMSLTQVGLEQLEGFFAWFDDAWTANEIDTLDPVGYYESFDLWFDVDAVPDRGEVIVTIYERNTSGVELYLDQSYPFEVEGLTNQDAVGFQITAVVAVPDSFDYRLELLSYPEHDLLDQIDYGDDPDLMDIPLCAGSHSPLMKKRVKFVTK
ncbi:hypothetical protein CEE37_04405 [candidate division LCP-89 bacterium B3_LCP]|uniref:Fibronectin type-III domain-containing protein n=1 Tax=candidate division LCP-89 bacterium B3_LCP TaxID=2012998 RepID=A0A532V3M4_UNCL8|nr:MAG: hypothetical protein CEE37_04405 [candidate division LCP-89 bacterium B3_LCP]